MHPTLKFAGLTLALCAASLFAGDAYYLSSSEGNDSNDGSIEYPWQTLAKISSVTLGPGDTVYFRRNDRFDGHFNVQGSGSEAEPITITAYGEGHHPVITGEVGAAGGGDYQEAILVQNESHFVFDGLEVNNERMVNRSGVDETDAFGLHIQSTDWAAIRNFTVRNMIFRNVYAVKPILREEGEDAFNGISVAGLRFRAEEQWHGGVQDVLVENCFFTDIQRYGINVSHHNGQLTIGEEERNRSMNLVFRNNEFHHTGGTCILPSRTWNVLIEDNLFYYSGSDRDPRMPARGSNVWTWRCTNTVIQHNYCISARGYLDSHGIHIDHQNVNTFVQYNYMEDNEGGFVEILGGNVNSVYRFNISVNEGWRDNGDNWDADHTIWINDKAPGDSAHPCEYTYIYNNTVYTDFAEGTRIRTAGGRHNFIYNNIFYSPTGRGIGEDGHEWDNSDQTSLTSHNLFQVSDTRFRNRDSSPVTGNPQLTDPGNGSPYGYQLESGSPAIDAGLLQRGPPIPGAGEGVFAHIPAYPTTDFFGNPVDLSSGTPNIGASNAKGGVIQPRPAKPVVRVAVLPGVHEMDPNEELSMKSHVMPVLAEDTGLTWASDNPEVATVTSSGVVTAHQAGLAIITATASNGVEGSSSIRVKGANAAKSGRMKTWLEGQGYSASTDITSLAPSGYALLMHYALDVAPTESITFVEGDTGMYLFNGYRQDVTYEAEVSSDLINWNPGTLTAPNLNGQRVLPIAAGVSAHEFYRIRFSIREF
jgi:hypothetical protein